MKKEAIEYLKNYKYDNEVREAIETVLNLLENKDKEIQFQKEINKTEQDRHKQTEKSLKGQLEKKDKQIEQYQNMLATNDMLHVLECEKKDKMIDEMAKGIYIEIDKYKNPEEVKQYYERKVENGN